MCQSQHNMTHNQAPIPTRWRRTFLASVFIFVSHKANKVGRFSCFLDRRSLCLRNVHAPETVIEHRLVGVSKDHRHPSASTTPPEVLNYFRALTDLLRIQSSFPFYKSTQHIMENWKLKVISFSDKSPAYLCIPQNNAMQRNYQVCWGFFPPKSMWFFFAVTGSKIEGFLFRVKCLQ